MATLGEWAGQAEEEVGASSLLHDRGRAGAGASSLPQSWGRAGAGAPEAAVTLDPQTFDEHPYTLRFLTYGSPLLETLLTRALDAAPQEIGSLLRVSVERPLPRVAYYALDENGRPRRLDWLADVRAALEAAQPRAGWSDAAMAAAQEALQAAVEAEWVAMAGARARLDQAQHSTQVARAARLLLQAALVELALGRQPYMFEQEAYPAAFDGAAVVGLKRHGYPWTPLLRIARHHLLPPRPTDPFFIEIQGEPPDRLRRRFETLKHRAERLVQAFSHVGNLGDAFGGSVTPPFTSPTT
jgi:hypothetical protein